MTIQVMGATRARIDGLQRVPQFAAGSGGTMGVVGPGEAASAVARDFGVEVEDPILLHDTNNFVFWLQPSPVVAKVGTGEYERLKRELSTAMALEEASAPVVGPSRLLPRRVHHRRRYQITFWHYVAETGGDLPASSVALALGELHTALARIEDPDGLAAFTDERDRVKRALNEPGFARLLAEADRRLLLDALEILSPSFELNHVLHGSPHRFNILNASGSPLFVDFEPCVAGRSNGISLIWSLLSPRPTQPRSTRSYSLDAKWSLVPQLLHGAGTRRIRTTTCVGTRPTT